MPGWHWTLRDDVMFAMLLILMIAVGNFALGFFLAVHFGYGPTGLKVAAMEIVRTRFRGTAQSGGPQPH